MASASAVVDVAETKEGPPQLIHDLTTAAKQGSGDVVLQLLQVCKKHGIDVDTLDTERCTALYHAADDGSFETCKALLDAGADCYRQCGDSGWTPLHAAAFMNHSPVIQLFLERGKEPDCLDNENATPLFWAARRGRVHAVSILLLYWADVNKRSGPYDGTALIGCCASLVDGVKESWNHCSPPENDAVAVIRLLVSASSLNVNIRNKADETALYLACLAHNREAVQLLLEADAHPSVDRKTIRDSTIDGMIQLFAGIPRVVGVVTDDGQKSLSDKTSPSVVGTVQTLDIERSAAVLVHHKACMLRLARQVGSSDTVCLNKESGLAERGEACVASVKATVTPSSSDLVNIQIPAEATRGDETAIAVTLTARPPIIALPTARSTEDFQCPPVAHDRDGSVARASSYVSIRHSNQAALVKQLSLRFVLDVALNEHHADTGEKSPPVQVMQLIVKKDGSVKQWKAVRDVTVSVDKGIVEVKVDPTSDVAASIYVAYVNPDKINLPKELQIWILGPKYLSPEMITEVACANSNFSTADLLKALSKRSELEQSLIKWKGPDSISVPSDSDVTMTVAMSAQKRNWEIRPEKQSFSWSLTNSTPSVTFVLISDVEIDTVTGSICTCHVSVKPDKTRDLVFWMPQAKRRPIPKSIQYFDAISKVGRSVCRIYTRKGGHAGTGTLVYQSSDFSLHVVLTAKHVLEKTPTESGKKSILKSAIFEFLYKDQTRSMQERSHRFYADSNTFYVFSPSDELDYALIAVKPEYSEWLGAVCPVSLTKRPPGYVRPKKWCFANHHANGRTMVVSEGKLGKEIFNSTSEVPDYFQHRMETDCGSSGACICDDTCAVLGLHTGKQKEMHKSEGGDDHNLDDESDSLSDDDQTSWNLASHINAIIKDLMLKIRSLQQDKQDIVTKIVCMDKVS